MDAANLYGMKVSGHPSRARSYFIKGNRPLPELGFNTKHYMANVRREIWL